MALSQPSGFEPSGSKLYTPRVLALALELSAVPLEPQRPLQGNARSRTCGSEVLFSAALDKSGAIEHIGMQVQSCAVGQGSAAIMAQAIPGKNKAEIAALLALLSDWLAGDAPNDILDRLDLLEPARAFPARHEAILLPWRAALDALSSDATTS